MPYAYWNGTYCQESEIVITPRDLGVLRGYAIFDVLPVFHSRPFLVERHFERLKASADTLGLAMPFDLATFARVIAELLHQNDWTEATVRTVLTGGPSADTFRPVAGNEQYYILAEPAHVFDPAIYADGVRLVTLEYERPLPRVKFANHAVAIQALPARDQAGAFETLYVKDGITTECSQSSLFWVKEGVLCTTWDRVLWGVTQGVVLELAEQDGRQTKKASVRLDELLLADEVFITGSSKGVVPVIEIAGQPIGDGQVGLVTEQCLTRYRAYCAQYAMSEKVSSAGISHE